MAEAFTCAACGQFVEVGRWHACQPLEQHDPLLNERGKTHGKFAMNAEISQKLKAIFWFYGESIEQKLGPTQREALDMIALKLSRILSGRADYRDHWDDIAGYAKLGAEACDG